MNDISSLILTRIERLSAHFELPHHVPADEKERLLKYGEYAIWRDVSKAVLTWLNAHGEHWSTVLVQYSRMWDIGGWGLTVHADIHKWK